MHKPAIKAPMKLNKDGVFDFLQQKLAEYDLSDLYHIEYKHEGYSKREWPGCRGWMRYPTRSRLTGERCGKTKQTRMHRLNLIIRGWDEDLPSNHHMIQGRMPRKYGYWKWPATFCNSVAEMMVWVTGHEMYHYLAEKGQLQGRAIDEVRANQTGNQWLEEYREWRR